MTEFGKAFRAARAAGKKTFSFQGKLYTTKLKEETKAKASSTSYAKNPKNVPVPGQRPSSEVAATQRDRVAATNADMAAARAAERSVPVSGTTPTVPDRKVAIPRVKRALGNAYEAVTSKSTGRNMTAAEYSPSAYVAPKKKPAVVTDTKPKKKVGPFGLGGMFKIGTKS